MHSFLEVKNNQQILNFINQTEKALFALGYTDHGLRHSNIVADRAMSIAKKIGLSERDIELAGVAGFCHDMGNFMTRTYHHYFGALLFHQVFQNDFAPEEMTNIMQAISNHDKDEMDFVNKVSAVLVLADKSDVHRSRVLVDDIKKIKSDIHDRVNYAVTESSLTLDTKTKRVTLKLTIDTNFTPIMEYFEIFTERMSYCRTAAEYLGYQFGIIINKKRLL